MSKTVRCIQIVGNNRHNSIVEVIKFKHFKKHYTKTEYNYKHH